MDAWIRPALLCATLLSVSAAPDGDAHDGARPEPAIGETLPETAAPAAASNEPRVAVRKAGFDGVLRTSSRASRISAERAVRERTAARPSRKSFRTKNFVAYAPTAEFARDVAMEAERCRQALAVKWLGKTLPPWPEPCPIRITKSGPHVGAGGATTFGFHDVSPTQTVAGGFRMSIQGSRERILDSVIPHEVNHTIFATHFGRPLPRWADEGAATLTEFTSEKHRQRKTLRRRWSSHRYDVAELLGMMEYPGDPQRPSPSDAAKVETLYAQGYSLADFLVQRGGKRAFLQLLGETAARKRVSPPGQIDWVYPVARWEAGLEKHFGLTVEKLEKDWYGWVMAGCPTMRSLGVPEGAVLAGDPNERPRPKRTAAATDQPPSRSARPAEVVRAQSEDPADAPPVRRDVPVQAAPEPALVASARPTRRDEPTAPRGSRARPAPLESFVPYSELLGD